MSMSRRRAGSLGSRATPALKSGVYNHNNRRRLIFLFFFNAKYTGFQKHLDDDSPAFRGLEWVEDLRDRHKALESKFTMGLGCDGFILVDSSRSPRGHRRNVSLYILSLCIVHHISNSIATGLSLYHVIVRIMSWPRVTTCVTTVPLARPKRNRFLR